MPGSPERFLVTGAGGGIGAWAVRLLLAAGLVSPERQPDVLGGGLTA
ncbi:MAG TPA: hypothetical protein VIF35_05290 [Streptosporangiaceae bacterium]|jgi:uncharacterized protein YbjT (DUF2867 family)